MPPFRAITLYILTKFCISFPLPASSAASSLWDQTKILMIDMKRSYHHTIERTKSVTDGCSNPPGPTVGKGRMLARTWRAFALLLHAGPAASVPIPLAHKDERSRIQIAVVVGVTHRHRAPAITTGSTDWRDYILEGIVAPDHAPETNAERSKSGTDSLRYRLKLPISTDQT